jgi:hypothetical protein
MDGGLPKERFTYLDIRVDCWLEPVDDLDAFIVLGQGMGHTFSQTILEVLYKIAVLEQVLQAQILLDRHQPGMGLS